MSIFPDSVTNQKTRRLEMEANELGDAEHRKLEKKIKDLTFAVTSQPNDQARRQQGILNMLRNTDHPHSVNTWWETAPSATDKDLECANVYAYAQIKPITISDATILAAR
jgi:hypothetical protein